VLCAVFGGLIASKDPLAADPLNALAAPSGEHWFGTDSLGRDSFARVMVGGREMLIMAPTAALLGTVLGTTLRLVAAYFRGAADDVRSRLFEVFLALPVVVFASVVLAALGSSRPAISRGRDTDTGARPIPVVAVALVGAGPVAYVTAMGYGL
jgi:peptide/nickel transport system permease protein